MFPHICCDYAKVVCVRQCINPFFFDVSIDAIEIVGEVVANVLLIVDELDDGVKGENEDDGAHWITLKNSTFE